MAMLSLSEQCVLQHHHLHDGRPPSSSFPPLLRPHQLKLSLRDVLQDVYNCELIQRRPIVEPLCQVVLRVKDVNRSNSSYEKAFGMRLLRTCTYSDYMVAFGTNILYKTAEAVWDVQGQSTLEQPRSNARIFASLDSDGGKADGARKALEQAFQGKNSAKKWEEEIRKWELSGGDGSGGSGGGGGGGSWGGGGGGDDEEMGEDFGQDEPWDWEEAGQTFMATFALIVLYISITHGPKQVFKLFKLFVRYIRQGFRLRKIPDEYLQGSDDDSDEDYDGDSDDDAQDDFVRNRRAELSNAREGDVQKNNSANDSVNDETEEDEDDDMFDEPTPPKQKSKREDLLSKRQAEQKEKLLQLLTPKERRQQEEKK